MAVHGEQELPAEVLMEILARLPAKVVSKFRCASKTLLDSLSDRFFFVTQSRRTKEDSALFVQGYDRSFEFLFLDSCSGVPHESLDFIRETGTILGSSNGLVLCLYKKGEPYGLCLYNPVRQTWLPLVCPDGIDLWGYNRNMGIGITFSESPQGDVHYQIVCLLPGKEWGDDMTCKIYSSRQRKWRETNKGIPCGARNIALEHTVISNGIAYMVSKGGPYIAKESCYYKPYIVAFDFERECSKILSVPEEVDTGSEDGIGIAAWGEESICFIQCYKDSVNLFTVWVMKDRWVRTHEVSTKSMGLCRAGQVQSFTLINSSTLVFTVEDTIYAYNLEVGELKELGEHGQGCYPSLSGYANTLRPCGELEWKIIKV